MKWLHIKYGLSRRFLWRALAGILLSTYSVGQANAMDFVIAGAPRSLVEDREFETLFNRMKANNLAAFMPTFQYQEIPNPKSFGFEEDFMAPCSPNDPAFQAVRKTGAKLLIPAELLYPDPSQFPFANPNQDPLRRIIACVGRKAIYAIANYDEAAFHGRSIEDVQRYYDHVKSIDATLPIFMVHGPMVMDNPQFSSQLKRRTYLDKVIEYSRYSDVVGFDVYPIPYMIAKLATPFSNGETVSSDEAVPGYLKWMAEQLPDKRKLIVLQGFSYPDMYETKFLEANIPFLLRSLVNPPNSEELDGMIKAAQAYNIEAVVWWGQAALKDEAQAPWPDILKIANEN